MILCWEAFEISSSLVTFFTSLRLTFSKGNLQPEFSFFILRMLGCFSKVLMALSIGSLCSLEISQRLKLGSSTIPSKYDRKISATSFSFKKVVSFSTSTIFSPFSVFSVKLVFTVLQKDLLSVIWFTLRLL